MTTLYEEAACSAMLIASPGEAVTASSKAIPAFFRRCATAGHCFAARPRPAAGLRTIRQGFSYFFPGAGGLSMKAALPYRPSPWPKLEAFTPPAFAHALVCAMTTSRVYGAFPEATRG